MPVGLAALVAVEGTNNFKDSYSPSVGVVISHEIGDRASIYAQPIYVNNSNPQPSEVIDDNDTAMLGLGARVRVSPGVYLVGEWAPRVMGNDPGVDHATFAIEKRAGGHVFQLNFSNNVGTTLAQVARGGFTNDDWFLGFGISRNSFSQVARRPGRH